MATARRKFVGIVAVLSVFATAAWERGGPIHQAPHVAINPEPNSSGLSGVWPTPLSVPGFHSASISSNGAFIATVSSDRNIICVRHQNGRIVWSKAATGVSNAVVSGDGKALIAYAALDSTHPSVTIFQGLHGETATNIELNGAIWDVKISSDSQKATVSTGAHTIYFFHLPLKTDPIAVHGTTVSTKAAPSPYKIDPKDKWPMTGTGTSLAMSKDGRYVVVGTWDQSGICLYDTNQDAPTPVSTPAAPVEQTPVWQMSATDDKKRVVFNRLFDVQIAHDANYVVATSYANFRHTNPTVYLWKFAETSLGTKDPAVDALAPKVDVTNRWTKNLGADASSPKAMITCNGRYVAVSYVSTVSHGDQVLQTKHLIVYNRAGHQVFYLPGFLFSPTLVAASSDGSNVLISDGSNKLYTVSVDGRMSSPRVMPSPIQQTFASEDGHFVLIYTADGNLNLMRLT